MPECSKSTVHFIQGRSSVSAIGGVSGVTDLSSSVTTRILSGRSTANAISASVKTTILQGSSAVYQALTASNRIHLLQGVSSTIHIPAFVLMKVISGMSSAQAQPVGKSNVICDFFTEFPPTVRITSPVDARITRSDRYRVT